MPYALGIDLGTTGTAAAVCRDGTAEIVTLGRATAVAPSVVFAEEDGTVLVGDAAAGRARADPRRAARRFKRRVGDPRPLLLAGVPWSPEALMARLLRWTFDAVSEREREAPASVAVAHPANWRPYKLDLLIQAARLAEIKVDRYVSDPEAAALAYAAEQPVVQPVEQGQLLGVYDLGGGTFDAAVLLATAGGFEILGDPHGIDRLGGIDFDQAVLGHVTAALGAALGGASGPTGGGAPVALAGLDAECTRAKEALSTATDASVRVELPGIATSVAVSRAEFEAMVRPQITSTVAALRRALGSAGVTPSDLAVVSVVGGSSRIPLVAATVGRDLGCPVNVAAEPKHVVAIGAALWAADARVVRPTSAGSPASRPVP